MVSVRPFYLPRQFPWLFFVVVYIHPCAKTDMAFETVKNALNKLDNISPDAPKFILGDFNHCIMEKYLKDYYQYVICGTHANKFLDR